MKFSPSKFSILLILIITTWVSSNLNWGKNKWTDIIESDGKGYYAYLPAIFIYNDLNFGFFDSIEKEKYYNPNLFYDYRSGANGKSINKYYCGTALAELPFFLIAHNLSPYFKCEQDGYTKLYPILINIAAIFYLLIGVFFLNKTLTIYQIGEWQKSLTLFAAVFGTNLFYYVISEPGMSHAYSFTFVSAFIFYTKKYISTFEKKFLFAIAASYGMIVLVRPVNGLILFAIFFLAENFSQLKKIFTQFLKSKVYFLFSILIFLSIIFIQLLIYKISTGNFFIYSYGDEKFNFFHPHFFDILFSYKKGLFLYTPMYFISLAGLLFLWKCSKFEFYSWLGFFILITYIFSSWWMWFYGGSFSSRVYVDYIPLFMILLGISLNRIKLKKLKTIFVSAIVILIMICQIQTYQYRYYQIHWADMTKEKYWNTFLRIDKLIK